MAITYLDLTGVTGLMLVLNNGVPVGLQTLEGEGVFGPIGQLPGITNGAAANAGSVGQLLQATTAVPVAFATTGTHNLISLVLPAGDWDVWGSAVLSSTGGAAVPTDASVGFNTTTGTLPAALLCASDAYGVALAVPVSAAVPTQPFNVTVNTTIYMVMQVDVTSGTDMTAVGVIYARRSR
jgi:hypothetical protein